MAVRHACFALAVLLASGLAGRSLLAQDAPEPRFAIGAYRPDGQLDPNVGVGGKVTTSFAPLHAEARAAGVDQQLGRLYAAGTATDYIAVTAYDMKGNLDPTFGDGGRVLTFLPKVAIRDMAVDASHRIVVVGWVYAGGWVGDELLIARYLPDGKLDPAFQGGFVRFWPSNQSDYDTFHALAVAIDEDRIVVSGEALRYGDPCKGLVGYDGGMLVARFEDDGLPDMTFGSGKGFIIDNLAPGLCGEYGDGTWHHYEQARDVAIDNQGRIVVAGVEALDRATTNMHPPGFYDTPFMSVRRYLPDGQRDPTFGPSGFYSVSPFSGDSHANALLIDPSGRIVVAGQALWGTWSFAVARLMPSGHLDPSFGAGGLMITKFGKSDTSEIRDVAFESGGRITVGGWVGTTTGNPRHFALARYFTNGSLDTFFGVNGQVTTDFTCEGDESIEALAVWASGKIQRLFAVGWAQGDPKVECKE